MTINSVENAYDRFLRDGNIARITVGAYFPSLVFAYVWSLTPSLHEPHDALSIALLFLGAMAAATISFYGIVGLALGRRSLKAVLLGRLPWRMTASIMAAVYALDMGYYAIAHRIIAKQTDVTITLDFLLFLVEVCILAPISEELAFQGYLQTRLRRLGAVPAMLLTTAPFVCIHISQLTHVPTISDFMHLFATMFPPLFLLAAVRQCTGSLLAAIILHSAANATIILVAAFVKVV